MKRIAVLFAALTMVFTLSACSGSPAAPGSGDDSQPLPETPALSQAPEDSAPEDSPEPEDSSEPEDSQPDDAEPESGGSRILVAYFSATNTTEGVAEKIAAHLEADLYEITPAEPYTAADLDYRDDNSRSTKEMNDPDARPAIAGSVEDIARYDVVFLGYPIWWGEAPRIVNTFVESYDFSGKTIVPFCTSGGSGMGSSASNLEGSAEGAIWLSGARLNGGASQDEIAQWMDGLGLELPEE